MSQNYLSPSVESHRIDGDRRAWRGVAGFLLAGLLLGAVLGGYYGKGKVATFVATVALSSQPDSVVDTQDNLPTTDATSFIQSQLVVLNGDQLAQQVKARLSLAATPTISATEVGQSYVVRIAATETDRARAVAVASTAASLYAGQRANQLTVNINASITTLAAQLKTVQASLITAQATDRAAQPVTAGLTPSETALQTEYERLLSQSSALKLALPKTRSLVTILSPAAVGAGSLSATTKFTIEGALLGALLGLAALILMRRLSQRIRSVGDIAALGVPVLLPVLHSRGLLSHNRPATRTSSAGRMLAARLTGHGPASSAPVILVGATRGVGASFVASSVAAGLAERGPVLLVLAAELVNGSRNRALVAKADAVTTPLYADRSARVADLVDRSIPSALPGVWLLPCGKDFPELSAALPSSRPALLADIVSRASAAGWLVVVDAPALADSDIAVDCAAEHGIAALVVARGTSRAADVLGALELLDAQEVDFAGAILNEAPRRRWQRDSYGAAPRLPMAPPSADEAPSAAQAAYRARGAHAGGRTPSNSPDAGSMGPRTSTRYDPDLQLPARASSDTMPVPVVPPQ